MTIKVTPETFDYVAFDSAYTARIAARVATMLGVDDIDIHIDIEESSPLTRVDVDATADLISIKPHSGALEDRRLTRQQSELGTTVTLAAAMLRARDRLRGGFKDAPADSELTLPQAAAWDTYIMGRLARMDIGVKRQPNLYNFRNRHGFNDAADLAFEKVWGADNLSWSELNDISSKTVALSA